MANQANITVKKNDNTTDILYTAVQPSSGDGVQAVWKALTVGTAPAHQPELRVSARPQSQGRREIRYTYVYPEISTNSTTGITSVIERVIGSCSIVTSTNSSSTIINEGTAQFLNLIASAHAKVIAQSGYGPT